MVPKFNLVITVFKTCRRQISILNTKHYQSLLEKLRVRKNDIMITKFSKNNSKSQKINIISSKAYLGKYLNINNS